MAKIDLNAVRAEAKSKRIVHEVEIGDATFEIPALEDWPLHALEAVQRGEVSDAFQAVMGPAAWKGLSAHDLTGRDLKALLDQLSEDQGLGDSGNSPASSAGSNRAGRRSKQT